MFPARAVLESWGTKRRIKKFKGTLGGGGRGGGGGGGGGGRGGGGGGGGE
jgi:hypothetical protein